MDSYVRRIAILYWAKPTGPYTKSDGGIDDYSRR